MLFTLCGHAQEKLGSYICSQNGETYDVRISVKGNGDFTLWIGEPSYDEQYPVGGIVVRENKYYNFLNAMESAKVEFADLIAKAKAGKLAKPQKSLRIFSHVDAYFKSATWNLDYKVPLYFDFKVTENEGMPTYLLTVKTGAVRSVTNISERSAGYGLRFTSIEDIDNFLQTISSAKIKEFIEKSGNTHSLIIKDEPVAPKKSHASGLFGDVSYGVKGAYAGSFGMNNSSSDNVAPYTLKTGSSTLSNVLGAGAFVRMNFGKLYFLPELLYFGGQRNYVLSFLESHQQLISTNKTVDARILDIPLMLGYKIWESNRNNFRLFAGPDFRINSGSSIRYTYFSTNSITTQDELVDQIKPFQLGLVAGLGVDFWRFTLDARYVVAGSNMFQTQLNSYNVDAGINNNSIQISLGLILN